MYESQGERNVIQVFLKNKSSCGLLSYVERFYKKNHADLRLVALEELEALEASKSLNGWHFGCVAKIAKIADKPDEQNPKSTILREKAIAFLERHSNYDSALFELVGLRAIDRLSTIFNPTAVNVLASHMDTSIHHIVPAMVALMDRQENINNNSLQNTELFQSDRIKAAVISGFAFLIKPSVLKTIWNDVASAVKGSNGEPNQNGLINRALELNLISDEQAGAMKDVFSRHAHLLTQEAMVAQARGSLNTSVQTAALLFNPTPGH